MVNFAPEKREGAQIDARGEARAILGKRNMRQSITVLIAGSIALGIALPAQATGTRTTERFANAVPAEQITRSRTDATEAAEALIRPV